MLAIILSPEGISTLLLIRRLAKHSRTLCQQSLCPRQFRTQYCS